MTVEQFKEFTEQLDQAMKDTNIIRLKNTLKKDVQTEDIENYCDAVFSCVLLSANFICSMFEDMKISKEQFEKYLGVLVG